jgi:hypothetical protein
MPPSFFLQQDIQERMVSRIRVVNPNPRPWTRESLMPQNHTLADIVSCDREYRDFLQENGIVETFEERCRHLLEFKWCSTLMGKTMFSKLKADYAKGIAGEGPHANDVTLLKVPFGGPEWPHYLLDGYRDQIFYLSRAFESGRIFQLSNWVSLFHFA